VSRFWLCFVPLFVAVDAIGILPMFMGLTEGLDRAQMRRVVKQSVVVAMAVALTFLAIGKGVLSLLGVTIADFMIAGGSLLFIIAVNDLLTFEKRQRVVDRDVRRHQRADSRSGALSGAAHQPVAGQCWLENGLQTGQPAHRRHRRHVRAQGRYGFHHGRPGLRAHLAG
jgi:hypothetical protein